MEMPAFRLRRLGPLLLCALAACGGATVIHTNGGGESDLSAPPVGPVDGGRLADLAPIPDFAVSPCGAPCGDAGSCDVDLRVCHGCLGDNDCRDAKNPFCDLPSGHCGSCTANNDKCPPGSYCAVTGSSTACMPGCK